MSFTDAHSSFGICSPSCYALLIGCDYLHKFHQIVITFGQSKFSPTIILCQKCCTIVAIDMWHLSWDWDGISK
jgi:arylsulfatase A